MLCEPPVCGWDCFVGGSGAAPGCKAECQRPACEFSTLGEDSDSWPAVAIVAKTTDADFRKLVKQYDVNLEPDLPKEEL